MKMNSSFSFFSHFFVFSFLLFFVSLLFFLFNTITSYINNMKIRRNQIRNEKISFLSLFQFFLFSFLVFLFSSFFSLSFSFLFPYFFCWAERVLGCWPFLFTLLDRHISVQNLRRGGGVGCGGGEEVNSSLSLFLPSYFSPLFPLFPFIF